MKKPILIPEWKQSLRWYSQHVNMALVSVAPVWAFFPEDWRTAALAHPGFVTGVIITMSVLGTAARRGRLRSLGSAPDCDLRVPRPGLSPRGSQGLAAPPVPHCNRGASHGAGHCGRHHKGLRTEPRPGGAAGRCHGVL